MKDPKSTPVPFVTKVLWLAAFGLLAYVMEYGLHIKRLPIEALFVIFLLPLGVLFAVSKLSPNTTGKLPSADTPTERSQDTESKSDSAFPLLALIYVIVYISLVFHFYPRPTDRDRRSVIFERLEALSPIELFWLIAPLIVLWWYRRRKRLGS